MTTPQHKINTSRTNLEELFWLDTYGACICTQEKIFEESFLKHAFTPFPGLFMDVVVARIHMNSFGGINIGANTRKSLANYSCIGFVPTEEF